MEAGTCRSSTRMVSLIRSLFVGRHFNYFYASKIKVHFRGRGFLFARRPKCRISDLNPLTLSPLISMETAAVAVAVALQRKDPASGTWRKRFLIYGFNRVRTPTIAAINA